MPCIAKEKAKSVRDFLERLEIKNLVWDAFRYTRKRLDRCTWRRLRLALEVWKLLA